ncbi:uncharacterized protein LOC123917085 [Trifolium pratense]|nr:uncharacterized protein LOC123917085 [Trifolium pratense]
MCKEHVFKTEGFHECLAKFFHGFVSKYALLQHAVEVDRNLKEASKIANDLLEDADRIGAMRVSRLASDVHSKAIQEIFDEVKILIEKLLVEFKYFKKEMIKLYKLVKEDTEMLGLY